MSNLFIIEAPGKLRQFYKILKEIGVEGTVIATLGHINDNPSSFKVAAIKYDSHNNTYTEPLKSSVREDVLRRLSLELSQCTGQVFIATDNDREGHVIADDINSLMISLKIDKPPLRLFVNELTGTALRSAILHATPLNLALAIPGHSRRIADRLITEYCSDFSKFLPVGRVQSAMMSLLNKGISKDIITVTLPALSGAPFKCKTITPQGMTPAKMMASLDEIDYLEPSFSSQETLAKAPNNTDITLGLSKNLNMTLYDATQLMQQLYEDGKITYHRTSSTTYRSSSVNDLKALALSKGIILFKQQSLPVEDAGHDGPHEAIRVLAKAEDIDVIKPYGLQKNKSQAALSYIARQNIKSGIPITRQYADTSKLPAWAKNLVFTRETSVALPWNEPTIENDTLSNEQALFSSMDQYNIGTPSTRALHVTKLLNSSRVEGLSLTDKGRAMLSQAPEALRDLNVSRKLEDLLSVAHVEKSVNDVVKEVMMAVLSNDQDKFNELIESIKNEEAHVENHFKP